MSPHPEQPATLLDGFSWRRLLMIVLFSWAAIPTIGITIEGINPFAFVILGALAIMMVLTGWRPKAGAIVALIFFAGFGVLGVFLLAPLRLPASYEFLNGVVYVTGTVTGVVAAIGTLVTRSALQYADSRSARGVAGLYALLLAGGLGVFVLARFGTDPVVPSPGDVRVFMVDFAFSPLVSPAKAGEVAVHLTNEDRAAHSFTIDQLDVDQFVPGNRSARVTFPAIPGTYEWFCRPHPAMTGSLTVAVE